MKFKSYKYKETQDKEGEVTLILKISQQEAEKARNIPVETLLDVEITPCEK